MSKWRDFSSLPSMTGAAVLHRSDKVRKVREVPQPGLVQARVSALGQKAAGVVQVEGDTRYRTVRLRLSRTVTVGVLMNGDVFMVFSCLKAVGGDIETCYNTGNRINPLNNLFDCFNFKLFGITLFAHGHLSFSHLKLL